MAVSNVIRIFATSAMTKRTSRGIAGNFGRMRELGIEQMRPRNGPTLLETAETYIKIAVICMPISATFGTIAATFATIDMTSTMIAGTYVPTAVTFITTAETSTTTTTNRLTRVGSAASVHSSPLFLRA